MCGVSAARRRHRAVILPAGDEDMDLHRFIIARASWDADFDAALADVDRLGV